MHSVHRAQGINQHSPQIIIIAENGKQKVVVILLYSCTTGSITKRRVSKQLETTEQPILLCLSS